MISYGLDYLRTKGFKKVQPPFFMNKAVMGKTAQLEEFDEALYKASSNDRFQSSSVTILIRSIWLTARGIERRYREVPHRHFGTTYLCSSLRRMVRSTQRTITDQIRRLLDLFPKRSWIFWTRRSRYLPSSSIRKGRTSMFNFSSSSPFFLPISLTWLFRFC